MSNILNQYVNEINQVYNIQDDQSKVDKLTVLLSISPSVNNYIPLIYNDTSLTKQVETLYDDDWPAFNLVINSFVKLCKEMDPWSLLRSFDLYTTYLNDLSIAFNNNNFGYLLSHIIKDTIELVVPWARKLDLIMFFKESGGKYRLNYLASLILKIFNNIRVNDSNYFKKSIILYLGNVLCFIYFKIDNPLLCRNIFSNMNNTSLKFKEFPLQQQLKYKYYLGKYYLIKYELIESYTQFNWCLSRTSSRKNQKLILETLIPVGLVIGKIPNFKYLHSIGLTDKFVNLYEQLANCIKPGNLQGFQQLVKDNFQYLKDKNVLLLLNKIEILIMRNYIKNIWKILGRPSNLNFASVPLNKEDNFKENLFVTLIDSNLIKGKLTTSRIVVLSKNDPFPNVFRIYNLRFVSHKVDNQWL